MKHTFWVASSLLLSVLLPFTGSAQTVANVAPFGRTQAQICRHDPLDDLGGHITGQDPGSRVNVRAGAGTHHSVRYQAVVGDEVDNALEGRVASDGYCWFKVRLTRSGVVGWVRSDFVELMFPDLPEEGGY
ncbi:SH3 domain-containing protein [Leptolyngbya sp. O-77]|uniref:SH3 domain-containing protein n=1 Tax=Leptolyngbya sp. O-77 TaxID=1080068 RepID=UPI0012E3B37B|nr:SH3 domain-containing protein [Leptolyngbya sp. O-77]